MAQPPDVPAEEVASSLSTQPNRPAPPAADSSALMAERLDSSSELTTRSDAAPQDRAPAQPAPVVPGYEILGVLGRGGMGVVYKALHLQLRQFVAIKMPLADVEAAPGFRQRFLREARAAAALRHPNICPIHHVEESFGRPFLVMPYIAGVGLRTWYEQHQPNARRCAELVARLTRAVGHAHQHGVIHRDIKPGNVMIEADTDQPILMDFGLAKQLGDQDGAMTQSGQILGTPAYMAPEQARGRSHEVGPLADVYALGAVLYHLLCERPPFDGTAGEILQQLQTAEPIPPRWLAPSIHRDLETICLKALAKEPAARYPSAGELAADLERFASGEAIKARRQGPLGWGMRWVRRHRLAVAVGLLLLAGVGFAVDWYLHRIALDRQQDAVAALLASDSWTTTRFEELETLLRALEERAPERARSFRPQQARAIFNWAVAPLSDNTGSLEAEDRARIEQGIALLERHDPEQARQLKERYEQRRSETELAFELKPPFRDLKTILVRDEESVLRRGEVLQAQGDLLLTRLPLPAVCHLSASFADTWQSATQLGILLKPNLEEGDGDGYAFLLRPVTADGRTFPGTFANGRASGGRLEMQILRNGLILRRRPLVADDLSAGPLRLEVGRARERLTFRLHGRSTFALECRDLFALGQASLCGLRWAKGVELLSLRAERRSLPAAPSPLERGDDLHLNGRLAEALEFYRRQARISTTAAAGTEARLKEGLTLLKLDRLDEAAAVLTPLAAGSAEPWNDLAALHLWFLFARRERLVDADLVLERLLVRRPATTFAEIVTYFPEAYSAEVLKFYRAHNSGLNYYRHDPERLRKIDRIVQVEELLNERAEARWLTYHTRCRAYRVGGLTDQAAEIMESLILDKFKNQSPFFLVSEYCWLLRDQRKPSTNVLKVLESQLYDKVGTVRLGMTHLLLDRARLLAVMGRREEAEKQLEDLVRGPAYPLLDYLYQADAWLMLGFLREERGDPAGAREAWRAAYRPGRAGDANALPATVTGMRFLSFLIAGTLCGEITEAEIATAVDRVFLTATTDGLAMVARSSNLLPPAIFRDCWKTPRGRAWARRLVFQEATFVEYLRVPPALFALDTMSRGAFGSKPTPEQEELLWKLAEEACSGVMTGTFKESQLLGLLATWKGVTNLFGWAGVRDSLAPSLRGPTAYVLGHRFLKRNDPGEARRFFEQAKADAGMNAGLRRLAQTELDQLPRK